MIRRRMAAIIICVGLWARMKVDLLAFRSRTQSASVSAGENQYNKTLNHKSHISIQLTARAVFADTAAHSHTTLSSLDTRAPVRLLYNRCIVRPSPRPYIKKGRKQKSFIARIGQPQIHRNSPRAFSNARATYNISHTDLGSKFTQSCRAASTTKILLRFPSSSSFFMIKHKMRKRQTLKSVYVHIILNTIYKL